MDRKATPVSGSRNWRPEANTQRWLPWVALSGLLGLLIFQIWAYYYKLPLSLGPRVILQPWLLKRGFVMYEDIVDLHSPLMPLLVATLTPLMPDGLSLAKLILVVLLSLSTLLTFVVGWRTMGWLGGLGAACFFVVWSPAFGFGKLWHESFLAPLFLLLFVFYDTSAARRSTRSCLFLGFLGGVAILFKQHAALVFAAFVVWHAFATWHLHRSGSNLVREVGLMGLGAMAPVSAYAVFQYAQAGSLESFWYWTMAYPVTSDYGSLAAQPPTIAQIGVVASSCLLLPAALFSAIDSKRKGDRAWLHLGLGLTLLAASSVTAYPRFDFFHLQATLPWLALTSALTFAYAWRSGISGRFFAAGITVALSAFWLITAGPAYRPVAAAPAQQYTSEYSDLVPLAQRIRQYIGPAGCIYLFPDDEATANLYYLLRCSPPRFWIFHYPWYMSGWVRDRILSSLDADPPAWVAFFPGRWDAENRAPEIVKYLQDHYQRKTSFQWAQGEVWLFRRVP
jgi:hypothetical protein